MPTKKRARETHPDTGGDEEEFKKVKDAYEVLSDEERRLMYDNTGETEKLYDEDRIIEFLIGKIIPKIMGSTKESLLKDDLISKIKSVINNQIDSAVQKQKQYMGFVENFQIVIDRLKLKEGVESEDSFRDILEERKSDTEGQIKFLQREQLFYEKTKEYIDRYEYLFDKSFVITMKNENEDSGDKIVYLGTQDAE